MRPSAWRFSMLVSEAALRFDLSPAEEELLMFSLGKPVKL